MKNVSKIILLLVILVLLTTYSFKTTTSSNDSKNAFFKIEKINVINTYIINESEIINKLKHLYGKNIITLNSFDVEKPLKSIDFINKIVVKKRYPETIIIEIYETVPVAIIYKNEIKYFLDTKSNLVIFKKELNFSNLPQVFGAYAEEHFINFYNQIKDNGFPINKIKNFYYFRSGRWDLQLINDKMIKFPDNLNVSLIKQAVKLLNREDFSDYNLIDLRIDDKIIVE